MQLLRSNKYNSSSLSLRIKITGFFFDWIANSESVSYKNQLFLTNSAIEREERLLGEGFLAIDIERLGIDEEFLLVAESNLEQYVSLENLVEVDLAENTTDSEPEPERADSQIAVLASKLLASKLAKDTADSQIAAELLAFDIVAFYSSTSHTPPSAPIEFIITHQPTNVRLP